MPTGFVCLERLRQRFGVVEVAGVAPVAGEDAHEGFQVILRNAEVTEDLCVEGGGGGYGEFPSRGFEHDEGGTTVGGVRFAAHQPSGFESVYGRSWGAPEGGRSRMPWAGLRRG